MNTDSILNDEVEKVLSALNLLVAAGVLHNVSESQLRICLFACGCWLNNDLFTELFHTDSVLLSRGFAVCCYRDPTRMGRRYTIKKARGIYDPDRLYDVEKVNSLVKYRKESFESASKKYDEEDQGEME